MSSPVPSEAGPEDAGPKARLLEAQRLHQMGRLDEPAAICEAILAEHPDSADAMHVLALVRMQQDRVAEAADLITRALVADPENGAYRNTRGLVEWRRGDWAAAEAAFRDALAVAPGFAQAMLNLGRLMREDGRIKDAEDVFNRAISANRSFAPAYFALAELCGGRGEPARAAFLTGCGWQARKDLEKAVVEFQTARALDPDDAQIVAALGGVLTALGRPQEAIDVLEPALAGDRPNAALRRQLAAAYSAARRVDDAVASYRAVVADAPNDVRAHIGLAQCLLTLGHFEEGWAEFEWRLKDTLISQERVRRPFEHPAWDGRMLSGERLLVHTEQGKGDILQFVRYLPMVKERGGHVILECERELVPLLERAAGWDEIAEKAFSPEQPYPDHDFHISLVSLPFIFGTTAETIPKVVPYLEPDPVRRRSWRTRLAPDKLKVGLAWAGNPKHPHDRHRSIQLDGFAPLGGVAGVAFYGLQVGEAATQPPPAGFDLTPLGLDFADTAAVMVDLDLVITVDTAMAHLAGALARPTWTLLAYAADWRWQLEREDSPWYPTMRLYRQSAARDWKAVIARVAEDLAALASRRSA